MSDGHHKKPLPWVSLCILKTKLLTLNINSILLITYDTGMSLTMRLEEIYCQAK